MAFPHANINAQLIGVFIFLTKKDSVGISKKKVLFQMSEIERALFRLEKAVEVLKQNFNRDFSSVESKSTKNENDLADLHFIKNQISNAIFYVEQMSLEKKKPTNNHSSNFDKEKETGERR